jgi:ABC-type multidrug transport system fused ATPase/permease subunit
LNKCITLILFYSIGELLNTTKSKLFTGTKFSFLLLSNKARLRYLGYIFLSLTSALLDLLAVGVLALTLSSISNEVNSNRFKSYLEVASPILNELGVNINGSRIYLVLFAFSAILLTLKTIVFTFIQYNLSRFLTNQQIKISENLTRRFFEGPVEKIYSIPSQEVSFLLNHGIYYSIYLTLNSFSVFFVEILLILGIISILLYAYPIISIVIFIFYSIVLGFSFLVLSKRAYIYGKNATTSYLDSLIYIEDGLKLFRELRASHQHGKYRRFISQKINETAIGYSMQNFLSQTPKAIFEGSLVIGLLFLAFFAFSSNSEEAALTTISVFMLAGLRLAPSLIKLQGSSITLKNLQPNIERLRSFIQNQITVSTNDELSLKIYQKSTQVDEVEPFKRLFEPNLLFEKVSYQYSNQKNLALDNLSFEISSGSIFGIVGETGSGKSTIADLSLGLISPMRGAVMLGGVPGTDASRIWPGKISYCSQKVVLTNKTAAENIALGCLPGEIDYERVSNLIGLLKLQNVFQFRYFGKSDKIGESGNKLSGGEQQRLAIARALYHEPKFMILDEPTSSQDAEMEFVIKEVLDQLRGSMTILIISHRSDIIELCDSVISIKNGKQY